jgi:hypothetical protein
MSPLGWTERRKGKREKNARRTKKERSVNITETVPELGERILASPNRDRGFGSSQARG